MQSFDVPLHFHDLTHQAKATKLLLFYLLPTYGTSLGFIASHENAEGHQRTAYCEQRILTIFGGGLATLCFIFSVISSSILKISGPFGSKYPEFSKTPPTFAFWMSLTVVMAVFPLNDIFFETLCTQTTLWLGLLQQLFSPC